MHKLLTRLVLSAALAFIGTSAFAVPIVLTGDGATNVDTLTPTIITLESLSGGIITDLNITIDLDANCCAYDNTVILTHVDTGSSAVLWFDADSVGAQTFGDVLDTTFDDEAAIAFINAPLATNNNFDIAPGGTFQAAELLSVFDGESLLGTWELSIQNTGCCEAEGDNLLGWSISAEVASVPEPGSLALFGLGFVLFGLARRRIK